MFNPLTLQVIGGFTLFAIVLWQLATGLRWIKLGKQHFRIHKWTGVTLFVVGLPHMVNGLYIAGIIHF